MQGHTTAELEAIRETLASVAVLYGDVVAHEHIIERRRRQIHSLLTGLAAAVGIPSATLGLDGPLDKPSCLRVIEGGGG